MRYEMRGFRRVGATPGSVAPGIGVGWRGIFRGVFVDHRLRDNVLFAGPITEIENAAALAAKWKISVGFRVGGLLADGTSVLHVERQYSRAERPDRDEIRPHRDCRRRNEPGTRLLEFHRAGDEIVILCFGNLNRSERSRARKLCSVPNPSA